MPAHSPLITKGYDRVRWPFVLLAMMFAISSGGLLWMMREALRNDQLAMRQRLTDVYRATMQNVASEISRSVQDELQRAERECHTSGTPQRAFAALVSQHPCDSVVVLDRSGRVAYPAAPAIEPILNEQPIQWQVAQKFEFRAQDMQAAADAYGRMAEQATSPRWRALNLQAQTRCLANANQRASAESVLRELSQLDLTVCDDSGRAFALDAKLRLLQWTSPSASQAATDRQTLIDQLNAYEGPHIHPDQRRFVMRELSHLLDNQPVFKMQQAEDLAAVVAQKWKPLPSTRTILLHQDSGCWQLPTANGGAILLFRTDTFSKWIQKIVDQQSWPPGVRVHVHDDQRANQLAHVISTPLGPAFAGWRLDLQTVAPQILDEASSERRFAYLFITTLLLATTLVMATWIARSVRHQLRVARMKNDLVATVSHELKTPLASMRLLVDTLLESSELPMAGVTAPQANTSATGDGLSSVAVKSSADVREYLQMISNENARLTRLIDNFLSYSRLERGRSSITREPLDAADIVHASVSAFEDAMDGRSNLVQVEIAGALPCLGDADRLVSALLNLLENAWKYTGDIKTIRIVAKRVQQEIHLSVHDNGIGIPLRHIRRIFDPFFQTDRSLARITGGCGLGLSIVESIAHAHGGRVDVQSVVGQGSQFTLILPCDPSRSLVVR